MKNRARLDCLERHLGEAKAILGPIEASVDRVRRRTRLIKDREVQAAVEGLCEDLAAVTAAIDKLTEELK